MCDPYGRPIRQTIEAAAASAAAKVMGSHERRERIDFNEARARLKKARELRLFIDGPPATAMMETKDRQIYFDKAVDALQTALNSSSVHVGPERVNHTLSKTKSDAATNTAIVWITLPEGETTAEWMQKVQWNRYKYIQMGSGIPPAKLRMQASLTNQLGLKPCCYLPRCAGAGFCLAHKHAYMAANCAPTNGPRGSSYLPPTHEQEVTARKHARQSEIEDRQAKEARLTLERSMRSRPCLRWRNGRCHRTACKLTHGSAEEAKKITCYSATAAGRKERFKCPLQDGQWFPSSDGIHAFMVPNPPGGEHRCPFNLECEDVEADCSDDDGLQKGNDGAGDKDYAPPPSS